MRDLPGFLLTGAVDCGALAALIGIAVNAPRAARLARDESVSRGDRAAEIAYGAMIVPALWASFGVAVSPLASLTAWWASAAL